MTLNLSNGGGLGTGVYPLLSYSTLSPSYTSAFTMGSVPSSIASDSFSFTTSGNDLDLVISAKIVSGQWKTNGSGTWSTTGNWTGGVPGSGQDTAVFGSVLTTGAATVTLDSSRSLSSLGFSTTGANSYTLNAAGGSTLTMANLVGPATISDSGGNHTVAVPVSLGSNLAVTATTNSNLTISGPISGTGKAVSLSGGGELILSSTNANTYTGGTTVTGGTLDLASHAALPTTGIVNIGRPGTVNLVSLLSSYVPQVELGDVQPGVDTVADADTSTLDAALTGTLSTVPVDPAVVSTVMVGGAGLVGLTPAGGPAPVPEPGTLALLLAGVAGLAVAAWRQNRMGR